MKPSYFVFQLASVRIPQTKLCKHTHLILTLLEVENLPSSECSTGWGWVSPWGHISLTHGTISWGMAWPLLFWHPLLYDDPFLPSWLQTTDMSVYPSTCVMRRGTSHSPVGIWKDKGICQLQGLQALGPGAPVPTSHTYYTLPCW